MAIKDYEQKRFILLSDQNYRCAYCGRLFTQGDKIELSHKVIKSKANIKLFGLEVIDHVKNLAATHPGKCNDGMIINRATQPIKAKQHIKEIQECLKK